MSDSLAARVWPPLVVFAGFLLAWQLLCTALAVPPYLVPTPTRVAVTACPTRRPGRPRPGRR